MTQDLDIDQLMAETWLTVSLLRHGAAALDGGALYETCCQQVESVRGALAHAGYDDACIAHISYAQCALLDEAVMGRKFSTPGAGDVSEPDAGQIAWRKAPLQARFFGTLHAGETLWDRIEDVLRQPSPMEAVLICYHRVMSLGFQGLYGVQTLDLSRREALIDALSRRVPPFDAGLSLVVHQMKAHRYGASRSIWFWIAIAIGLTGALWWGGHLWLQALLSEQIPGLSH